MKIRNTFADAVIELRDVINEKDSERFIEITNNGDTEVDLTGIYFRELGVTYGFPVGATLAAHEPLLLCSDSLAFIDYYHIMGSSY